MLGAVRFLEGFYLVVVTKRRQVAMIGRHAIYKVEDTAVIPLPGSNAGTPAAHPNEARYVRMFCNVDMASNFYFSYTYDLTSPLQRNMHVPAPEETRARQMPAPFPLHPDPVFVWNSHLLAPFSDPALSPWNLSLIHGFVAQSCLSVFGKNVYVALIARRSRFFAGARFLKRGANHQVFEDCLRCVDFLFASGFSFPWY